MTYAAAIMMATKYSFASVTASFTWLILIWWHRTPVWPFRRRSTATLRSSAVRNQAETGEFGIVQHQRPNRKVNPPARM